jgi:hypothetical protein
MVLSQDNTTAVASAAAGPALTPEFIAGLDLAISMIRRGEQVYASPQGPETEALRYLRSGAPQLRFARPFIEQVAGDHSLIDGFSAVISQLLGCPGEGLGSVFFADIAPSEYFAGMPGEDGTKLDPDFVAAADEASESATPMGWNPFNALRVRAEIEELLLDAYQTANHDVSSEDELQLTELARDHIRGFRDDEPGAENDYQARLAAVRAALRAARTMAGQRQSAGWHAVIEKALVQVEGALTGGGDSPLGVNVKRGDKAVISPIADTRQHDNQERAAGRFFKLNATYSIAAGQKTDDLIEDVTVLLDNAKAAFESEAESISGVSWCGLHFLRMGTAVWEEVRGRKDFYSFGSAT